MLGRRRRFHSLRMCLRDAVFGCRIARFALLRNKLSLAANAALQLRLYFLATPLLERIGATAGKRCARDREQDRHGLHPLILGMKLAKANRQDYRTYWMALSA